MKNKNNMKEIKNQLNELEFKSIIFHSKDKIIIQFIKLISMIEKEEHKLRGLKVYRKLNREAIELYDYEINKIIDLRETLKKELGETLEFWKK